MKSAAVMMVAQAGLILASSSTPISIPAELRPVDDNCAFAGLDQFRGQKLLIEFATCLKQCIGAGCNGCDDCLEKYGLAKLF
ncbi:hypothetical protein DCS_08164 [Drechmeria coniospora]|uniref:Uncharacterized protein n=1 Tax=Drechmeria coniospora TaxID=98403 RepID=A0A151GGK5_DRECN|nr:hypothetical protein DCS_08164 [Drechmeria coniospora]KYK56196.1 hypothetical protein DCS_08164 [Drechmeria coniospora]